MPGPNKLSLTTLMLFMSVSLYGCDADPTSDEQVEEPPRVAIEVVQPQSVTFSDTLPGRVSALREAEIRPQVSGIIQHRFFEQGAEIKKGSPLFQIDQAPFKADVDSAKASLLRVQASWEKAKQQTALLRPLVQSQAVSRQSFDDAVSDEKQAAADVAQARATLTRRQLDLSFARVDAPIAGRIDQALTTEGAYVTPGDSTPLAKIYQTDPIYVDVRQPADSYDSVQKQLEIHKKQSRDMPVQVIKANGEEYEHNGKLLFSGISVDPGTGEVLIRAQISNPERVLLPGMFVRVKIPRLQFDDAIMVPQQSVVHENGETLLWVVNDQQQAKLVEVEVAEISHGQYRIAKGISPGTRVVVQGMDRLSEDTKVVAVMSNSSSENDTMAKGN